MARFDDASLRVALRDIGAFSATVVGVPLREYQLEVARAVLGSIQRGDGTTFTVLMPRQAGKNELSAHLEAFLLIRKSRTGGLLVKCAPTFAPQLRTSMVRLERVLANPLTERQVSRSDGHQIGIGRARISFLSAEPTANVVGATANVLLECDEAQDVDPDKWDRDFRPMGATANVTSVLYGTPWSDDSLLARQIAANLEFESRDGIRRHFQVDWERVAAANPLYRRHVEAEIARLGAHHPIVRTQYLLRSVDAAGRFLDASQVALMLGDHPPATAPRALSSMGRFVAGIDVAGEDEEDPASGDQRVNPRRDSTVMTIAWAEDARVDERVVEPTFRVVCHYVWRGTRHRELYPRVLELVRSVWHCDRVVVDATGVGGGLAAFLAAALGPRVVMPFVYTAASKSALAYDFLAAVNGGRFKLYAEGTDDGANDTRRELLRQASAARYSTRANQAMAFFVPESVGHDDLLNAAALVVQARRVGAVREGVGRRVRRGEGTKGT
jgi:hypothetical protein